ncbi:hypothetical protein HAX54_040844, partial [Datura stramonium]|nr:hypothetical protein [Datura stramonium]
MESSGAWRGWKRGWCSSVGFSRKREIKMRGIRIWFGWLVSGGQREGEGREVLQHLVSGETVVVDRRWNRQGWFWLVMERKGEDEVGEKSDVAK